MKKNLNIGKWNIIFYDGEDCKEGLQRCKTDLDVPEKIMAQAKSNSQKENCGSTISNISRKLIRVFVGPQTSKAEMLNTLSHEIRHVVDTIAEHTPIESAAELTGAITARFADWV